MVMAWEINHNLKSSSFARKDKLNFDVFNKIVGNSCVIKEIREVVFGYGIVDPPTLALHAKEPKSKFGATMEKKPKGPPPKEPTFVGRESIFEEKL